MRNVILALGVALLVGCANGDNGKLEDAKTADANYKPKETGGSNKPKLDGKVPGKQISPDQIK